MHLVYFISVILFSSKHTLLLTDLGAFIYYVMRPDTKLELHEKELKKLELQKNEPSKLELHKFEPMNFKNSGQGDRISYSQKLKRSWTVLQTILLYASR